MIGVAVVDDPQRRRLVVELDRWQVGLFRLLDIDRRLVVARLAGVRTPASGRPSAADHDPSHSPIRAFRPVSLAERARARRSVATAKTSAVPIRDRCLSVMTSSLLRVRDRRFVCARALEPDQLGADTHRVTGGLSPAGPAEAAAVHPGTVPAAQVLDEEPLGGDTDQRVMAGDPRRVASYGAVLAPSDQVLSVREGQRVCCPLGRPSGSVRRGGRARPRRPRRRHSRSRRTVRMNRGCFGSSPSAPRRSPTKPGSEESAPHGRPARWPRVSQPSRRRSADARAAGSAGRRPLARGAAAHDRGAAGADPRRRGSRRIARSSPPPPPGPGLHPAVESWLRPVTKGRGPSV